MDAKCGRLIGFRASDRYGWNSPSQKDSCALVIEFTLDRREDDMSHRKAMKQLFSADQTKKKAYKNNRTQMLKHFDEEGTCVVLLLFQQFQALYDMYKKCLYMQILYVCL